MVVDKERSCQTFTQPHQRCTRGPLVLRQSCPSPTRSFSLLQRVDFQQVPFPPWTLAHLKSHGDPEEWAEDFLNGLKIFELMSDFL